MRGLVGRGVTSRSGQRGQSLVEFALVLPLLLIVLFLVVDFGVGFTRWIAITNATGEGARLGAVGADPAAITQRVVDTSNDVLTAADVSVCYVDEDGDGVVAIGDTVLVKADYNYALITPLGKFITLTFTSIPFHSSTDHRLEQVPDPGPLCP